MDSLVAAAGEIFGPFWGLILALAAGLGGLAMWLQGAAVRQPGPDRERLLQSLQVGGDLRQLYVFWLTRALNRVDRFLGDADKAACSLPSPFGNRVRWPYWTGWSFDVCALIAVVYPILGVLAAWVWTDDVGRIGRALGLSATTPAAWRLLIVTGLAIAVFVTRRREPIVVREWPTALWLTICCVAAGAGIFIFTEGTGYGFFPFVMVVIVILSNGFAPGLGPIALWAACFFATAIAFAESNVAFFAVTFVATYVGAHAGSRVSFRAAEHNFLGMFWLTFWPIAVGVCYLLLWFERTGGGSQVGMLFLVMLGLVPLVNIPFDWASIGITRALLRRGCERDAPSPLWLGLLDFALGAALLIGLAAALLAALLAADYLTSQTGTPPLIDLPGLFHRLVATPYSPANWWIYLTLFSTLIPSVLNCLIGAVSLVSWSLPSLRRWMLAEILTLEDGSLDLTRKLVLLALGGQVFVGTLLTGGAFWALAWLFQLAAASALSNLLAGAEAWVRILAGAG